MATPLQSSTNVSVRILLIEDNDISRQLMSDFLSDYGYQILPLADATSFSAAMLQFRPEVILLDLKLPDIDGYSVLEQLQQHPEWQHVPVIVISAFAFNADKQRALTLGARRYLVKPVKLSEVIDAISAEIKVLAI